MGQVQGRENLKQSVTQQRGEAVGKLMRACNEHFKEKQIHVLLVRPKVCKIHGEEPECSL